MILGYFGASPADRTPFSPPPIFYQPRMPRTNFPAGFRPMQQVGPHFPGGYHPHIQNSPLPRYGARAQMTAVVAPPVAPAPGPTSGPFGRSSVYDVMRAGLIPRVGSNASNVMVGVQSAGKMIKQLTPYGYTMANLPAGGYY